MEQIQDRIEQCLNDKKYEKWRNLHQKDAHIRRFLEPLYKSIANGDRFGRV